jgi:hypothetical protein
MAFVTPGACAISSLIRRTASCSSTSICSCDDIHEKGITWQLTTVWWIAFHLGPVGFGYGGFAHFIGKEGGAVFNIITQQQLLLDVLKFAGYPDQLLVGVELELRYNEFGIKGQHEAVPQLAFVWKL